nr:dual specificity protein kinase lkh1 [Quercus suber]
MVKIEDQSILQRDALAEYNNPLPQKAVDGRVIYLSRNNYGQFNLPTGLIEIIDFGLSVLGDVPHDGCIQAEVYRAPEVILDAGYTYAADIWSLGVMVRRDPAIPAYLANVPLQLWDLLLRCHQLHQWR